MAISHSIMGSKSFHSLHVSLLTPFNRLHIVLYSAAILALFYRHLTSSHSSTFLIVADTVLAFMWLVHQGFRWRPVYRPEQPQRLFDAVDRNDLPPLDIFICTADPRKEPPMSVTSTALSVMAFDYPPEKISVYVSDDGGSDLTLFAFMEAARFARHWLPFCRENGIEVRSPEAYFASDASKGTDVSEKMMLIYQTMRAKVESVMEKGFVGNDLILPAKEYDILKKFKGFTRQNHPSIIEVLLDSSKDRDTTGSAMPNLIYVSREKRATTPHHFKAGAQNALLRVSSVMTNAPILLTLDCDTYSNDPQTPYRALCYLLDSSLASKLSYVQFPQRYQGINKNDIYGGELRHHFVVNPQGMDGQCGPNYVGTGCFFARRSFYGPPSSFPNQFPLGFSDKNVDMPIRSEEVMEKANEVSGCKYELGTSWGSLIGFRYGSLVEDYNTGYHLHCEGWQSVLSDPERPAFIGDAPKNLNESLSQCRRWIVGLYEVTFSRFNPLIYGIRKASFLVGLCYASHSFWGTWCIPVTIYALIPQLALIYDIPLFPKVSNAWFYLYAYLYVASYCHDLIRFLIMGGKILRWWSDQRMWLIRGLTSLSFATTEFALNQLGVSVPVFSLTSKVMEEEPTALYDEGLFYFGVPSPFFVVLGTVAVVNLSSFVVGILKAARKDGGFDEMFVQLCISGFGVLNCWPVIEAMFVRRDGGKMPRKVTSISFLLAGLLCSVGYLLFHI